MKLVITVVLLSVSFLLIAVGIIGLVKNDVTYKKRRIIIEAIGRYHMDKIDNYEPFDHLWGYMEDYDKTFSRWFDWGYKRILPPDKFELVKPYIEDTKGAVK
jgi:hypothetical protein